jgi:hypothetical protein
MGHNAACQTHDSSGSVKLWFTQLNPNTIALQGQDALQAGSLWARLWCWLAGAPPAAATAAAAAGPTSRPAGNRPRARTPTHPSPAAPRGDAGTDSRDPHLRSPSPARQGASAAQQRVQPPRAAVEGPKTEPAQPPPHHTNPSASHDSEGSLTSDQPADPADGGAPAASGAAAGEPLSQPPQQPHESPRHLPAAPPAAAPSPGADGSTALVAAAGFPPPIRRPPPAAATEAIAATAARKDGSRSPEEPLQWAESGMRLQQDPLMLEAGSPSQLLRGQGQGAERPRARSEDAVHAPAAERALKADSSLSPRPSSGSPTSMPEEEPPERRANQPYVFAARVAAVIAAANARPTEPLCRYKRRRARQQRRRRRRRAQSAEACRSWRRPQSSCYTGRLR